jgi:hypothetical protein
MAKKERAIRMKNISDGRIFHFRPSEMTDGQLRILLENPNNADAYVRDMAAIRNELQRRECANMKDDMSETPTRNERSKRQLPKYIVRDIEAFARKLSKRLSKRLSFHLHDEDSFFEAWDRAHKKSVAEAIATGVAPEFNKEDGTLYIEWSGPIAEGMADHLRAAVGKYGTTLNRVVLFLDSAGGYQWECECVIAVLNEIKLRHQLITVVPACMLCGSMCIPIFLQGEDRLAARASIWLFHQARERQANGVRRTDMALTWRFFREYYVPAGVPMRWLKSIAPLIKEETVWQTGGDLISAKSGIIMHLLHNA